jgi:4-amino-4-deoxy-L-arabinose transferase-like glycosyltransferase
VNDAPQRKEERLAKRTLFTLAWLAPCLILSLVMLQQNSGKLYRVEAIDAAQVARQVSNGQGFSTKFLRPLSLAVHPAKAGENYPDLYQAPLYPLLLGLGFTVFPDNDRTVTYFSALIFFLTLLALFFLGSRLFDEKVAALAVVLFGVNFGFLELATSGSPLTLWALLLVLALLVLQKPEARRGRDFWVGVLLGLSILTEYASFLLLPGLLWYVMTAREKQWRSGGIFLLGVLLPLIPWGVRNTLVAGAPFFSLRIYTLAMFTQTYPGYSLLREMAPPAGGVMGFLFGNLGLLKLKLMESLRGMYAGLPVLYGIYVLPFFIAGMLLPLPEGTARRLRTALYLMTLFIIIGLIFTTGTTDLGAALLPLITLFAAAFFWRLLSDPARTSKRAGWAIALLLVAAALPVLLRVLTPAQTRGAERGDLDLVNRILPAKAVVLSDTPWAVAWYAKRTAIWLPGVPVEAGTVNADPTQSANYAQLAQKSPAIDAIFLTRGLMSYPPTEKLTLWQSLRTSPPGFRVEGVLPQGSVLLVKAKAMPSSPPATGETPSEPDPQTSAPAQPGP